MPLYEFSCSECHHDFEMLVRSVNWKGTKCPKCNSEKIAKKLSVFASQGGGGDSSSLPACTTNPRSCGRCGTGVAHSH